MADVFLSYAREDGVFASLVAKTLEEVGYSVWWDTTGLLPGGAFAREIEEQLRDAKAVFVLWSKRSAQSDWVRDEADEGKRQNKLVTAIIDDLELPPMGFRSRHVVLLRKWLGEPDHPAFGAVLRAIVSHAGAPRPKPAVVAPPPIESPPVAPPPTVQPTPSQRPAPPPRSAPPPARPPIVLPETSRWDREAQRSWILEISWVSTVAALLRLPLVVGLAALCILSGWAAVFSATVLSNGSVASMSAEQAEIVSRVSWTQVVLWGLAAFFFLLSAVRCVRRTQGFWTWLFGFLAFGVRWALAQGGTSGVLDVIGRVDFAVYAHPQVLFADLASPAAQVGFLALIFVAGILVFIIDAADRAYWDAQGQI